MKNLILILASVLALTPSLARAEVFVWQDPTYDLQVTFPDNWMRQANLQPDLRLNIVGPQGTDHAACRVYASNDGRYVGTPPAMGLQISAAIFDQNEVMREFYTRPDTNYVRVISYGNTSALGSGAAVTAQVEFQKTWMGQSIPMHALAIASQYNGNRFFMTCEAMTTNYARWDALFRGIFKSVSFPNAYSVTPNGQYRRFQDDGGVILPMNIRNDAISVY